MSLDVYSSIGLQQVLSESSLKRIPSRTEIKFLTHRKVSEWFCTWWIDSLLLQKQLLGRNRACVSTDKINLMFFFQALPISCNNKQLLCTQAGVYGLLSLDACKL